MTATKPPSIKQLKNEEALKVYAATLSILLVLVAAARWLRIACNRHVRPWHTWDGAVCRAVLRGFRRLEKRARGKWLGQLPMGLLVLLGVLAAINAVLCFTVIAGLRMNIFASRLGWLAVANMALCVLMGLRNTPLSSLAVVSHTYINLAHRILGYSVAVLVVLHAVLYTVFFDRQGRWHELIAPGNVQGFTASAGMAVLLLLGYLRHRRNYYEVFYASHVLGFVATVFFTALHRPDWAKKLPLAMSAIFGMWVAERALRAAKVAYHLVGARLLRPEAAVVVLYPLAEGGVRLVFRSRQAPLGVQPGSHCYLWIPCIGLGQSHPFTVVSSGPWGLELVIQARDGFTRRLSGLAIAQPGAIRYASIDGPYGLLPDLGSHEKLVLVAGGSGAAFTFGLMNRLLVSHAKVRPQSVDFVWAVKRSAQVGWFRQHMNHLKTAPEGMKINVTIFVTGGESAPDAGEEDVGAAAHELDALLVGRERGQPVAEQIPGLYSCTYKYGPVDTDVVLWDAMQTVGNLERSLVATCGPMSMMGAVRNSVEGYRKQHRHRIVNFYSEEFH